MTLYCAHSHSARCTVHGARCTVHTLDTRTVTVSTLHCCVCVLCVVAAVAFCGSIRAAQSTSTRTPEAHATHKSRTAEPDRHTHCRISIKIHENPSISSHLPLT